MKKKKRITNRTFLLTAVIGSLLIMGMVTAKFDEQKTDETKQKIVALVEKL